MPFYIVGKEISLEDVRLTLEKMPDRFFEHPVDRAGDDQHVLRRGAVADAEIGRPPPTSLVWHEVALTGNTSHEFEEQITELQPFLAENWKARVSAKTGNPIYERPVVLVIYRAGPQIPARPDHPASAAPARPITIWSSPRSPIARAPRLEFKAQKVMAPLARALGPGGRHDRDPFAGHDPGLGDRADRSGRARTRSPPTATSC